MKRIIILSLTLLVFQQAIAALPPRYQNINDLDVMVDHIMAHPEIASTLKSIDMVDYTIRYGNGCKAEFGRKSVIRPPDWVGPAEPLEFKRSICPEKQ